MSATLFVGVILPEHDLEERWDVLVDGHEIVRIERTGVLGRRGESVIEGNSQWLLPGFIDDHVHLREPGLEHKEGFETGTRAAAAGGVTTLLEIQNNPPLMTTRQLVEAKLDQVRPRSVVNIGVYGSLTPEASGHLGEMSDLVAGYKLFMGCSTGGLEVESEEVQRALFTEVAATGHWLFVHAEDQAQLRAGLAEFGDKGAEAWHLARSGNAEIVATQIALRLGAETGARVHVFHVSAGSTVDVIEQARADGQAVTAGTCPHYLYFTEQDTARLGTLLKVNPSIKTAADRDRLLAGLASGTIDCLSSDHAPHTGAEKSQPFAQAPSGIPTLDIFMPLCLTLARKGLLPLATVIDRAATTPAKVHGFASKGRIDEGLDADLVLVDPDTPRVVRGAEHFSKAKQTPYEGMELYGWPVVTMVMGKVVHEA